MNDSVNTCKSSKSEHRVPDSELRNLFNASPHIIVLFDSSYNVIDCNPIALQYMAFDTLEDMIGGFKERMIDSIPPFQSNGRPSIPISERFKTATIEGRCEFNTEIQLFDNLRTLSVEMKKLPFKNDFAIATYIVDETDVYEQKRLLEENEKMLEQALKQAEVANKAKSVFLSTISHEIRTPMNSILGTTEIQLQSDMLDAKTYDAFKRIYASGDLLLGIINDILDLSKIEVGRLELANENYDIASLINNSAQLNVMHIMSKPIEFELDIDEETPATFNGDELRVKQVLNNLLSNAFKYTNKGKITLSVHAEERNEDNKNNGCNVSDDSRVVDLVFVVADTGRGMTEEQREKLFDEYTRFNVDSSRTIEGTGLGMSIVHKLIKLMDGTIDVESTIDKGSTFTVRLPQTVVGSTALGCEAVENLRFFRTTSTAYMKRVQVTREPMPYGSVLIVDDVEANIYVASGLMLPYGLKIDSACSGYEAIEKVKDGNIYDIIFMDHMMPKMDGIEAVKIILDLGYKHPIVALTANAVVGQSDMFLNNGFSDFIAKPIDLRQLNAVLNKFIRDKQPPEVIEAARRDEKKRREAKPDAAQNTAQKKAIDPRLIAAFSHDAIKSIVFLESVLRKKSYFSKEDISAFATSVHGIKSALANISKHELSAMAYELEMAAKGDPPNINLTKTSVFINSMKGLMRELKTLKEAKSIKPEDEDRAFLQKYLDVIKTACENCDEKKADNALSHLLMKTWSSQTDELIEKISRHVVHGKFDEIITLIENGELGIGN